MAYTRYYRNIQITNNENSDIEGYQVAIKIEDPSFLLKADPNNLIFKDGNTILPYWVEYWRDYALIWTKIDMPASQTKEITLYYGGYIDWIEQDGDSVFEFFDDFNSINLDENKWRIAVDADGGIDVNNIKKSCVRMPLFDNQNGSHPEILCNISIPNNIIVEATFLVTGLSQNTQNIGLSFTKTSNDNYHEIMYTVSYKDSKILRVVRESNWKQWKSATINYIENKWHKLTMIKQNSQFEFLYGMNSKVNIATITDNYSFNDPRVGITSGSYASISSSDYGFCDYIFVRKKISSIPVIQIDTEQISLVWHNNPNEQSVLSGITCDKNGNPITGKNVNIYFLKKDTGEIIGKATSNATDGSWNSTIDINPNTKVLSVFALEGDYNGDTDIAGAEFDITQEGS